MNFPSAALIAGSLFLWRNGKFLESLYLMWREETVGFLPPFFQLVARKKDTWPTGQPRGQWGLCEVES